MHASYEVKGGNAVVIDDDGTRFYINHDDTKTIMVVRDCESSGTDMMEVDRETLKPLRRNAASTEHAVHRVDDLWRALVIYFADMKDSQ